MIISLTQVSLGEEKEMYHENVREGVLAVPPAFMYEEKRTGLPLTNTTSHRHFTAKRSLNGSA